VQVQISLPKPKQGHFILFNPFQRKPESRGGAEIITPENEITLEAKTAAKYFIFEGSPHHIV
jgi:hypothetical protein